MTDDLVKRLREYGSWETDPRLRSADELAMLEAADALERLSQQAEPTRSQKLAEAGFTRRPSWKSLPSDADEQQAEPVAWRSEDWKLIVRTEYQPMWPSANIPLYAAPPADDEAVRLLEEARMYVMSISLLDRIDAYLAKGKK